MWVKVIDVGSWWWHCYGLDEAELRNIHIKNKDRGKAWVTEIAPSLDCVIVCVAIAAKISLRILWCLRVTLLPIFSPHTAKLIKECVCQVLQHSSRFVQLHFPCVFFRCSWKSSVRTVFIQVKVQSFVRASGPGLGLLATICFSSCFLDSPCEWGEKVVCMCWVCGGLEVGSGGAEVRWRHFRVVTGKIVRKTELQSVCLYEHFK